MPKKSPSDYRPQARFPAAYKKKMKVLAQAFKAKTSDLLRMGIDRLWSEYEAKPAGGFTGPPELQDKKWEIIRLYRDHYGEAEAARLVGTTKNSVREWRRTDQFFDEMCRDSCSESIERVQRTLWTNAVMRQNNNACFGILNALTAEFGLIKKGYAEKEIGDGLERLYPILARHVPSQTLDTILREYAAEFGDSATPDPPKLSG